MVSDQFQSFHKHNLLYENSKEEEGNKYFDLVTAKEGNKLSELPTFLKEGVETNMI